MHRFFLTHQEFGEEAAKIGVWDFDTRSGLVDWSYGMELIYGLAKGTFKGTAQDFIERIHPDDVTRFLRESQEALDERRPFNITFRIIRADGAVRWVNSRGSARWDASGAHLGASGIQLDISEQVERNAQLRLQGQIIANMAEGVVMVRTDNGQIAYANPCFERMLGYASGAMVGLHVSAINGGSGEQPKEVAHHIMTHLYKHGHWRGEVLNRRADGRDIWTSGAVSVLEHETMGKVWISVHADINAQRLAQQALDDALVQLRRLSLNIQDSIEAERLAVSRDVHDQLGASLTGIHLKLEALASRLGPDSEVLARELMDIAQSARTTQLAARDICNNLRPQLLDDIGLVGACRWYVRDWSSRFGIPVRSRFATLKTQLDGRLATDMFRVLQELLTNVARHSGATQVQVSMSATASSLVLRVQDNGRGFATDGVHPGFGLMGLRERVRQHQGQLHIDSSAAGTSVRASMQHLAAP